MPSDKTERLLNKIGQLLAEDTEYPLDGTLLYAELDRNFVAPSIFKDRGNHVLYRDPDLDRLSDALLDLWEAETPDKRWAEIEYVIRDGRFDVAFTYPEEIDPGEEPMDRRKRVVARHFGDKPIVYPPPPEDDDQLFDL
ncbi:hypothetical protein [Sphingosinicella humi]|uniref:Uncharacterized protein n=1 Tax=Allosphingosinicella humi TaxID=2068657 RepID=A0A2U2J2E8_9SPHN|nr:hypothetical protein [Sphingosinicella humi]PWG02517.1 hypothetical protein DF286_06290 [Sphingosinicella humi]